MTAVRPGTSKSACASNFFSGIINRSVPPHSSSKGWNALLLSFLLAKTKHRCYSLCIDRTVRIQLKPDQNLNANLLIQARIKATEALKSAFDRRTKGRKARQPHSKRCPVRYNERTYKLDWASQTVTLVTL